GLDDCDTDRTLLYKRFTDLALVQPRFPLAHGSGGYWRTHVGRPLWPKHRRERTLGRAYVDALARDFRYWFRVSTVDTAGTWPPIGDDGGSLALHRLYRIDSRRSIDFRSFYSFGDAATFPAYGGVHRQAVAGANRHDSFCRRLSCRSTARRFASYTAAT